MASTNNIRASDVTIAVIDDANSTVDVGGRHSYRRGEIDPNFYEKNYP